MNRIGGTHIDPTRIYNTSGGRKLDIRRTAEYARRAFYNLEDLLSEIEDSDWSDYLTPEEYGALDKAYDVLAEFYKDMASLSKN